MLQGRRKGGPGGPRLQSTCLAPPINKLSLLKTAVFVLNLKFWSPCKSTALAPALRCCNKNIKIAPLGSSLEPNTVGKMHFCLFICDYIESDFSVAKFHSNINVKGWVFIIFVI